MSNKKKLAAGITAAMVALAIAIVLIFTMNNRPMTAADMLSLGERYLLEMQFEQAIVQFLAVIEIEPMNVRAYLGAAEAFVGLGQMENAANILRQGLERTSSEDIAWAWVALDSDNYQIYLTIANLLIALADSELGARLGANVLCSLAIEILRMGLERTGSEQIRQKLAELEGMVETPGQDSDDDSVLAAPIEAEQGETDEDIYHSEESIQATERALGQGEHINVVSDFARYKYYLVDGIPQSVAVREWRGIIMAFKSGRSSVYDDWEEWTYSPHYWAGLLCTDCGEMPDDGSMPEWFGNPFSHPWSGEWREVRVFYHD